MCGSSYAASTPGHLVVGRTATRTTVVVSPGWRTAVAAGLTSLGWSAKEAVAAADGLAGRLDEVTDAQSPDIGVLLKEALRSLDRL